jgi:uncharacterized protein YjiS (DUF1127 family)
MCQNPSIGEQPSKFFARDMEMKMMIFSKKEREAIALFDPTTAGRDCEDKKGKALETRERLAASCRQMVRAYRQYRKKKASEKYLYRMSDRELRDIGIVRTEIDSLMMTSTNFLFRNILVFVQSKLKKFGKARSARSDYIHLTRMDARHLSDIGLTRGDINSAFLGTKIKFANENLGRTSNDNKNRRAS